MTEIIDAAGVEIATRPNDGAVQMPTTTLFGTDDAERVVEKATAASKALVGVVEAQKLYTVINEKKYPRVEAWTLLGSMVGVFPVTIWTHPVMKDGDSEGWEARVEAHTMSGAVIGAAECMCTRSETRWEDADDHAIRSMAQTRATSKALGMPLRFMMSLAGFEGTPAEEMQGVKQSNPGPAVPCPSPGCTGSLRQRTTKKGSPFLSCDSWKSADDPGCQIKPMWNTTLEQYRSRQGGQAWGEEGPQLPGDPSVDALMESAGLDACKEIFAAHNALVALVVKGGKPQLREADWNELDPKIRSSIESALAAADIPY